MGEEWEEKAFSQTQEAYGEIDLAARDRANRRVLEAATEDKPFVGLEADTP
jgi:hypothetical protein